MYTVKTNMGREVVNITTRQDAIHHAKALLLNVFVAQTFVVENSTGEVIDSFVKKNNDNGEYTKCGSKRFDIVRAW